MMNEIFSNLKGIKKLKIFKNTGHENYLTNNKEEWANSISEFIMKIQ